MVEPTSPLEDQQRRLTRTERPHDLSAPPHPTVLDLDDPRARDAALTGAKAAALATAAHLGLPVVPGLVITTTALARAPWDARHSPGPDLAGPLRAAWWRLSGGGTRPLAVRSSSTVEDSATSSMAGVFTSVLDVAGWDPLRQAVAMVLRSADDHPMAVLLQPMLDAAVGGVLFGVDPITGQDDRLVVESVPGGPSSLVSGLVAGTRHVLTRRGRLLEADRDGGPARLGHRHRLALANLATATAAAFGGPQDVEWAFDGGGRVWLLQSRPVTATGGTASGPVLGPGPVAETLPHPLAPLETDLWVEPLRAGVVEALRVVGATPRRALAASPVVAVVGGRVAADLELLGASPSAPRLWHRLDPRPPARRLGAAWRVGRLRRAIPLLAADVIATVDAELAAVPPLAGLDEGQLLALLDRCRLTLRSVHGHEVLAGVVAVGDDGPGTTAAALALGAVAAGRAGGLDDDALVAEAPVVLALITPAVGRRPALPPVGEVPRASATLDQLPPREALRLRARWLQELSARAAAELGRRLHRGRRLEAPELVRWLQLDELAAVATGAVTAPHDLAGRAATAPGPPLPNAFRLTPDGDVVAERPRRGRRLEGRGAGGGRGMGPVRGADSAVPSPGSVLVVPSLEPGLAAVLPGLGGLVAETGSVLSHLAILARELGVPTVVGVADARRRFPPGTRVVVDGITGEVARVGGDGGAR
ncbi:MAG: PEP/pyruvate-binding domain-containing protein [Acidimicrobiales bacterium]